MSFGDLNLNYPPFFGIFQPHVHGPLQHFRVLIMTTTMMIFMVLDSRLGITIYNKPGFNRWYPVPLAWYWDPRYFTSIPKAQLRGKTIN